MAISTPRSMSLLHSLPRSVPALAALVAVLAAPVHRSAAQARLAIGSVSPSPAAGGATVTVSGAGFDAPNLVVVLKNNDARAQMSSYNMQRYVTARSASRFAFPLSTQFYSVAPGSYTLHLEAWDATGARMTSQTDVPLSVSPAAPVAQAPATTTVALTQNMAMITDDGRCIYGGSAMGAIGQGRCDLTYGVFKPVYHASGNYYMIVTSSGQCVTTTVHGAPASTQGCTGAAGQKFYFDPTGQIQVVGTSLCLDLSGGQWLTSYKLIAWDCDLTTNQAARAWNQRFMFAYLMKLPSAVRTDQTFVLGNTSYQRRAQGTQVMAAASDATSAGLIGGGAHVVAGGGANVVAGGGANVVAAGGANVVAGGGANVVAGGGANITVPASGVVGAGGANMISVGTGN